MMQLPVESYTVGAIKNAHVTGAVKNVLLGLKKCTLHSLQGNSKNVLSQLWDQYLFVQLSRLCVYRGCI